MINICIILLGLQNDHKNIMKKIEDGLHKVHGLTGNNPQESPSTSIPSSIQENVYFEPFLRVNLVTPGSPAELAVLF